MPSRSCLLAVAFLVFGSGVGVADAIDGETPPVRLSKSQPESGRFVETTRGYMLAYVATIPGSNAQFEMVPVPGGRLVCRLNNGELATVEIKPFWISRHEVTWHEYAGFMALHTNFKQRRKFLARKIELEQADAVTAPTMIYETNERLRFATSPNRPATTMSQYAARQYTKWLSILLDDQYRLPSEAEWTYACLAPADHIARIPAPERMAEELMPMAVFAQSEADGPQRVGSRQPNAFGLRDMLGNVSEWVLDSDPHGTDRHVNDRQGTDQSDSRSKPSRLLQLPAGSYSVKESLGVAATRFAAVACGGGCWDRAEDCQPTSRLIADEELWSLDPDHPPSVSWMADFHRDRSIGFRVLRGLDDETPDDMQLYWLPDNNELADAVRQRIEWRDAIGVVQPSTIDWELLHFPFGTPDR